MATSAFRVVIPARFESSRLPGKVLIEIGGKPMLRHVWERARESQATEVVVATDSAEVAEVAAGFGADVCLTSGDCNSGTDRVAEVCRQRQWAVEEPVVNVQGDVPLIPPASIDRVAGLLALHPAASVATLCTPLRSADEYRDPHVVKVVCDSEGRAMYFSRSPLPGAGHGQSEPWQSGWRHIGLYAYRIEALLRLAAEPVCELERLERLEQLRALWLGMEIRVIADDSALGPDVDTRADVERVAELLGEQPK